MRPNVKRFIQSLVPLIHPVRLSFLTVFDIRPDKKKSTVVSRKRFPDTFPMLSGSASTLLTSGL